MSFDYAAPQTLREALSLLSRKGGARVLAGGTDLLVSYKRRELSPQLLIDLKKVPGLTGISYQPGRGVSIGALTTIREIETSPVVKEHCPALAEAAGQLGSVQVRHRATLGGNLCNAAPSAETAPPLLAYGAVVRFASARKEAALPLEGFFQGPGKTFLKERQLLLDITIPGTPPATGGCYLKLSPRGPMDIAIVGVAAVISLEDGRCSRAAIALGAVAPTPMRASRAEELLLGKELNDSLLEKLGAEAASACKPIDDIRASAEYRRAMVAVLTKRAVRRAWSLAQERGGR